MVPGRVESWILIADFKDVGVTQIPVSSLKDVMVNLMQMFTGRMFRGICVNVPMLVKALWEIGGGWFDEYL